MTITTKRGLLFDGDTMIPVPEADRVANRYGFVYAEQLVKYLEKRKEKSCKTSS